MIVLFVGSQFNYFFPKEGGPENKGRTEVHLGSGRGSCRVGHRLGYLAWSQHEPFKVPSFLQV